MNLESLINNENINTQFDLIHIHANITKTIISFFINKSEFLSNKKKNYLTKIIIKTAHIIEKINDKKLDNKLDKKLDKKIFNIILLFIGQIDIEIHFEKYFEIVNLFLKKLYKGKIYENKLQNNILLTQEFSKRIEDTPEKFITWLLA
jgi:hypothetical protein